MNAGVWLPVAAAIGAVLAAIVAAMSNRKKLGADATEIITRAAAGVVDDLREDRENMRKELEESRAEHKRDREEYHREMDNIKYTLQLHAAWDALAVAELGKHGISNLPPVPPLLPPADYRLPAFDASKSDVVGDESI